jgi:hypothetical protein
MAAAKHAHNTMVPPQARCAWMNNVRHSAEFEWIDVDAERLCCGSAPIMTAASDLSTFSAFDQSS